MSEATFDDILEAALERAYDAGASHNNRILWEGLEALTSTTAARLRGLKVATPSRIETVRRFAAEERPLQVGVEWVRELAAEIDALTSTTLPRAEQVVEMCEAGCGPATKADSQGVPLCDSCAWALDREVLDDIAKLFGFDHDKHDDLVSVVKERITPVPVMTEASPIVNAITGAFVDAKVQWSRQTFGPGSRTIGICNHIRKELLEAEANPRDVSEWADIILLAMDGAVRAGATGAELVSAVVAKDAANRTRTWPDWRSLPADAPIEHEKPSAAAGAELPEKRHLQIHKSATLTPATDGACAVLFSDDWYSVGADGYVVRIHSIDRASADSLNTLMNEVVDEHHPYRVLRVALVDESPAPEVPVVELDEWRVVDKDGAKVEGCKSLAEAHHARTRHDYLYSETAPHKVVQVCVREVTP